MPPPDSPMDDPQKVSSKKRGLGRGLDALLGATRHPLVGLGDAPPQSPNQEVDKSVSRLPIELIQPGRYQPRRDFDPEALRELAESIAAQGVIQPIVVRPVDPDRYEIVAGERRWRAAQQAGLAEIPVVVRDVDEPTAVALGLIENIQREDLNPIEQATALDRLQSEFRLTHQQIAEVVGKSRTTVTNLLRLLELNPDVRASVQESQLEMGHARALLGLKGTAQSTTARHVVSDGLSVRETERLVRRLQQAADPTETQAARPEPDPNVRRLQDDLTDRLGAKVQIQQGSRGAGKLVIAYNSLDELDGILARIK